tara:strand:- start:7220 stop:7459 length:240 start_codon:yes stop_codon:yes gene_type:complete
MSWKKERMHIDLFALGTAGVEAAGDTMSYKDDKKKQGKKAPKVDKGKPIVDRRDPRRDERPPEKEKEKGGSKKSEQKKP